MPVVQKKEPSDQRIKIENKNNQDYLLSLLLRLVRMLARRMLKSSVAINLIDRMMKLISRRLTLNLMILLILSLEGPLLIRLKLGKLTNLSKIMTQRRVPRLS